MITTEAFFKDAAGYYRAQPLEALGWLEHGFGTKAAQWPENGRIATLKQIHSDICVAAGGRAGCLGEGDALLENKAGRLVGVKTADCLPILIVDERLRAVAAVHAGWRGSARQIAARAVDAMRREFGSRPEDLHAALGPGIGACCYEVGAEVAAACGIPADGPVRLNLVQINRRQLRGAGVDPSRIYSADLCTRCRSEFHSFRRDGDRAGRMISFAGVR